jgi:hypothetical protein
MTKKCSMRTISKHQGSYCKHNDSTDRGIEKWFPGMFPKAVQMLAKEWQCPKEVLERTVA